MKLKTFIAVVCCTLVASLANADTIVYDTFGPGNTYDGDGGYSIGNGSNGPNSNVAAGFTSNTTGFLSTVVFGVTFIGLPEPMNVVFYTDNAGSPNTANQTLLGQVTPTTAFGPAQNNSVVTLVVAGNVALTIGTAYWIGLLPVNPTENEVWNSSLPATIGPVALGANGSYSDIGITGQPAFRVTARTGNGVPETGSTLVLLLGAVGMLAALRSAALRS